MSQFRKEAQRPNFVRLEEEILALWDREKTFERSVEQRRGREKFVFIEGPPTANGLPHPGHILTRAVKDLVLRYKTMRGFYAPRRAGWDTHGLPVEIEVEKELGLNTKGEIEKFGIERFNQRCRDSVFRYEKEWVNATRRVGFWIDMDSPYITFKNTYIESVWWSLKEIWKRGLLYKGYKVVPFCPRCETTLSSHEVAQGYRDVEDPSIYVKFRMKSQSENHASPVYLLAWTTTPWTLIGNIALAVHPQYTYVKVRVKEGEGDNKESILILAEARLDDVLGSQHEHEHEYEILERFKGEALADTEYEPLFEYAKITGGDSHKVVTADFVSLEEGTGIVHIAPAFGEVDYEVCRKHNLGFTQPVDTKGRFKEEVTPLAGVFVKDADDTIIKWLKERGVLFKEARYLHSYPFCWRCGSPLLYYARESWFIAMSALRDNLIANNEKIRWYPSHLKYGRFGNFLENIEDWALSRERFWGTPLNIWVCSSCGAECCVGSIKELRERAEGPVPDDLHRPYIDAVELRCENCGGKMKRVKEVIDCWYDSGSAPFAQWHYPFEDGNGNGKFRENYPADFITEAIDQTRGWFYSLLAVSTAIFDEPPYLNVLSLGHILDEKGVKMSKSRGNVVDINTIFNKEGADALRWYFFTAGPPYEDIRFSERDIVERNKKFMNTFWNSYFFFITYATIDKFSPRAKAIPVENRAPIDRWILSRLNSVNKEVIAAIESFDIHVAARKLEDFVVNDLSNWYIRRSRRRFWVPEANIDKDCAYLTLYEVLVKLCKLLAPFVPFITEYIYQNLVRGCDPEQPDSVHLCDYPAPVESQIDIELEESMLMVIKLVEAGRRARSEAGLKIRQPLRDVVIVCGEAEAGKCEKVRQLNLGEILRDELNVHEVKFATSAPAAGIGYKQVSVDGAALFLNTQLDKELRDEGLVRDIVRRVQGMRKELELEYTAEIRIMYEAAEEVEEAIEKFASYICAETLAVEITRVRERESERGGERGEERIYGKNWKIAGKDVYLAIEPLN